MTGTLGFRIRILLVLAGAALVPPLRAQTPTATDALQFDVVSIKKSASDAVGGGARTLPDGTEMISNQPIRIVFARGATEPTRDVEGLPSWAMDRYDITVKPPGGSSREQRAQMWRTMLADRMKLASHVERRDRDGFALVLARSDGRLGPNLKPSALDCAPKPGTAPPPATTFPTAAEMAGRCGALFGPNSIVSGGTTLDALAPSLSGMVGGLVNNRTGLTGFYALELHFAPRRALGAPSTDPPSLDDPPDILTAVQEQLGLKFQRERFAIPVLVIDHVEPPTEN